MRWAYVLVMCAACGEPAATPDAAIDADPICGKPAPAVPDDCIADGLAESIDGTWTLTGHSHMKVTNAFGNHETLSESDNPLTASMSLQRTGTGWCAFSKGGDEPETFTFVNDQYVASSFYTGRGNRKYYICRRSSDGALYYRADEDALMNGSWFVTMTEGVLTR